MDLLKALKILGISSIDTLNLHDLKKSYYKSALKEHPDHNPDDIENSNKRFQEVGSAYEYLTSYLKVKNDSDDVKDYSDDVKDYSDYYREFNKFITLLLNSNLFHSSNEIINIILSGCQEISLKTFMYLDKQTSLQLYEYIEKNSLFTSTCTDKDICKDILLNIKKILKEKLKENDMIILNPTLDNILSDDIYVLNYNEKIYYIPLWHDEISYDIDNNKTLSVKCIPGLPQHMWLDANNELHINISADFSNIINQDNIEMIVNGKVFKIPVNELYIRKNQEFIFNNEGVSLIDTEDVYNVKNRGNLIVNITLYSLPV
jgi:hypothetical protein